MRVFGRIARLAAAMGALASATGALAQTPAPITLAVDASEAPKRIFHVTESIPAAPGALTLVYPKWIPGEHSPSGPITELVGLTLTKNGRPVPWKRVATEMWSFTCDVPAGTGPLEVAFDYVTPLHAATTASARIAIVNWWSVLLYPQGPNDNATPFAPSLRLPGGWKYATALPAAREAGDTITFQRVSLVMLIDSPVLAGAYLKTVDLTPGEKPGHWLHLAGESAASVEIGSEDVAHYKRLVAEALALFGARHYESYHFLLALSDHIPSNGLEHHEASDNRAAERSLTDESARRVLGTLLSHEYVHSWNGKYRRPAGLVSGVSADYQAPVDSNLLWVYEGLTEYYGDVLGARSGLRTPELYRENLALVAAGMDNQAGRAWRPLEDTAVSAQLLYDARGEWTDWRRGVDFYPESELVWLEADTIIRQKSRGRKSLDDFVKAFHGAPGGGPAVKTYRFEDVVAALDAVAPYDWTGFFQARIRDVAPRAPLGGIEGGGWKLVYTGMKPELTRASEEESKVDDFWYSLGIMVQGDEGPGAAEDGLVRDAVPGLPAAKAGIAPGMRLVAVNGRRYSERILRDALKAAKDGKEPIELLVENVDIFKTVTVDYHGGERYPHLERDAAKPDYVSAIGAPLAPK
ncbi:MAG TPA: PDZ domain-containing protein [Thermoanaerobaculia bacterium]|jgi:predicted metalloprotease with PDZ domain|nr:PDZ domain-containing protein [Thermoanaerobaculia bacterium]